MYFEPKQIVQQITQFNATIRFALFDSAQIYPFIGKDPSSFSPIVQGRSVKLSGVYWIHHMETRGI